MKSDAFKNRSIDESINVFIEQFAANPVSSPAKLFLHEFSKYTDTLPESEKVLAQSKLDAIKTIYAIDRVSTFRETENGKNDLSPPSGLALTSEGNLIVSDDFNHRIQIYDKSHKLILQFGSKGNKPGELHYPKGIAVDPDGNIYVADSWNHRVQKFDSRGNHLAVIGAYGNDPGQMNEPYAVHIDPMRHIIVVERYNHRIQIFSADGVSLGCVGTRGTLLEEKLAYLFETPAELIAPPVFEFPTSIACDSQHNTYIADSGNHRIVKFNAEWKQVCSFGTRGSGPGQFQYPQSIASGPNDLLYVADLNNDRIQVFTSQGQFIFAFSEAGTPIQMPCLTLVDSENKLYVGLTFDAKINVFSATGISQEALYEKKQFLRNRDHQTCFYKGRLFEESGALDLAAESYSAGLRLLLQQIDSQKITFATEDIAGPASLARLRHRTTEDNARLLTFLDQLDHRLHAMHQQILATHAEWDSAAIEFGKKFIDKETARLENKDDPRAFDKAFYLSEIQDKELFRKLRLLFCDYKKLADVYAEFTLALLQNLDSEADLSQCGQNLGKRMERICALINNLVDIKEKNEESMIRFFEEASDNRDKWQDFRTKEPANTRIFDVIKLFHYELRTLFRTFKCAALEHPSARWACDLLEKYFISHETANPLLKIILRNHNHYFETDRFACDLIDAYTLIAKDRPSATVTITPADLAPMPYDVENISTENILGSMLAEGMPLASAGRDLLCGGKRYPLAECSSAELAVRYNAIFSQQDVYENKYAELFNQIESIQQQRLELDTQLSQVDVRDKKAPIPIQKNIQIIAFQANLLGRMIITLEINEAINLSRLLVCGGLIALHGADSDKNSVFASIRDYRARIEQTIGNLLKTRKQVFFDKKAAELSLEELNKNISSSSLEQLIATRKLISHLQTIYGKSESAFRRYVKTMNILCKLTDFIEETDTSATKDRPRLKCSFGMGGPVDGKIFHPLGLAYSPEEDILVVEDCHRVCRFSSQGNFISEFGGWGSLFGLFKFPTSIATDSAGNIYVTDTGNQRIQKFTRNGEFILSLGDKGRPEEKINGGISLSIDGENRVWVSDLHNHRIQVYRADGKHLGSLGQQGRSKGDLFEPVSVLCLENGDYLVGDRSDYLLKRFNAQGKLVQVLDRDKLLCDSIYYITSHPAHGIFAADSWMNRVLHLDFDLKVIAIHDRAGKRGDQLGKVCGLSIKDNSLAVANYDTGRIHLFDLSK